MKEYIQSIAAGLLVLLLIVLIVVSYYALFLVLIVVFSLMFGYLFVKGRDEHKKINKSGK